jgi:hypothetical protein
MTNSESVNIWNITYDDINILSLLPNDSIHYLLDNNNNSFINKLLNETFFKKNKELIDNKFIEVWKPKTYSFQTSYFKKENFTYEHPFATFALFLSDDAPSIISFDLDLKQYKYKLFIPKNNCVIIHSQKGNLISINPKNFYGFLSSNNNNSNTFENILMINLWQTKPLNLKFSNSNNDNYTNIPLDIIEKLDSLQNHIYIENSIFNEQFYEQLLYKKNNLVVNDLYSQINENYPQININTTNLIIHSQNKPLRNQKYFQEKREKYGNIINDIYEIEINKVIPANLLQKSTIPYFFAIPITSWFNIELNKNENEKLWKPIENNTSRFPIETLSYLTTFVFTHTEQILDKIKEIYQLGILNIHINNYFIEKIPFEKDLTIEKTKTSFISFYIVLKGSIKLSFEKESNHKYIINTGDLYVFADDKYSIKCLGSEDIIVLVGNIEYTI